MKVSILTGGAYAYAVIEDANGVRHDIRLEPGRGPQEALREYAQMQTERARIAKESAQRALRAIKVLGAPKAPAAKFVADDKGHFAFKCEGLGIIAIEITADKARESWRESYIAEYCYV
jgi:hypothetical protein